MDQASRHAETDSKPARALRGALLAVFLGCSAPTFGDDAETPLPPLPTEADLDIEAHYCDVEPRRELCPSLPHDVLDFSEFFVYMLIEQNAQNPFDLFSWQTFVALNWPVVATGDETLPVAIGAAPGAARRWQFYDTPDTLFDLPSTGICSAERRAGARLVSSTYIQAGGAPLVDQAGNYVIYDLRVNPVMSAYIRAQELDTIAGQRRRAAAGEAIDFPRGYYDDPAIPDGGSAGAMTLKTAWRVLVPGDIEVSEFYVTDALLEIPAAATLDGEPLCLPVRAGLVAMHIVRRVASGNGGDWIWTTFEHVDNAPFADHARGPNSIFVKELFPDGCAASPAVGRRFSFHSAACADCEPNAPPAGTPRDWKWAREPPYARYADATPIAPTQVSRCWLPSLGTRYVNRAWRDKLAGTLWSNYRLSTTQWKGANKGFMFPHGEVPRYLTNSAIETYQQTAYDGSCLGCHAKATTAAGQPANLSFILSRARERD